MQNEQNGSDFWNRPDWSGGDNLRSVGEPFWMLPPLAKVARPDMSPIWPEPELFYFLPGEKLQIDRGRSATISYPY